MALPPVYLRCLIASVILTILAIGTSMLSLGFTSVWLIPLTGLFTFAYDLTIYLVARFPPKGKRVPQPADDAAWSPHATAAALGCGIVLDLLWVGCFLVSVVGFFAGWDTPTSATLNLASEICGTIFSAALFGVLTARLIMTDVDRKRRTRFTRVPDVEAH
jgi:hypothetical protein